MIAGFVAAIPGMLYMVWAVPRWIGTGRRYATYDQDIYIGGISIGWGTVIVIAIIIAPLLLFLSIYLFFRGWMNHRKELSRSKNSK